MRFDQSGTTIFVLMRGRWGQWEVRAEGFEKRLAAFDNCDDAIEFAQDLADTLDPLSVRIYAEEGAKSMKFRATDGGNRTT